MDLNPDNTNTQSNNIDSQQPQGNQDSQIDSEDWIAFVQSMDKYQDGQQIEQEQSEINLVDNDNQPFNINSPVNTPVQLPQNFYTAELGRLELQDVEQHQNIRPIQNESDQQSQSEKKKPSQKNYMSVVAVKFFQAIAQQVLIRDYCHQNILFEQQVQEVADTLLENVFKKDKKTRRNKEFLLMAINPVDDKLNDKIKTKRLTQAHKIYFNLLKYYGKDVMDAAKKLLISSFLEIMTDRCIELYALQKKFKTDEPFKQQVLLKYLLEIKFQLRENGKISGRC